MPNKISYFLDRLTRKDILRALRISLYGGLVALVVLYGLSKTHDLVFGTTFTILSPENGATLTDSHVRLVGKAPRAATIYIDDGKILADEAGNFVEPYILAPGLNTFRVRTEDNFGRTETKTLSLIYNDSSDNLNSQ